MAVDCRRPRTRSAVARGFLFAAPIVFMAGLFPASASTPSIVSTNFTSEQSFSDHDATQLLQQIGSGLTEHNPRKVLGAFDLEKMNNGAIFKQQIESFLSQTGTTRVYYNLVRTSTEGERGTADVTIEMEANLLNDNLPPLHKQAQLHFIFEKTAGRWKIVDLEPRSFFSTQP